MSNLPIFDVAGSALQAQSVRLNTIASNLSNADSIASSPEAVYKPLEPIFQARPLNALRSVEGVICPQDVDHFAVAVPQDKGLSVSLANYNSASGLLSLCVVLL